MEDITDIWHIDRRTAAGHLTPHRGVLSAAEEERAARFIRPTDRDRYLESHIFLRLVLASYGGAGPRELEFGAAPCAGCGQPHGKPVLISPSVPESWNLSHAIWETAVVVSRVHEVGIDVADIETDRSHDVGRLLHPREIPIAHGPAFYRIWARKEAAMKACGAGLTLELASFDVTGDTTVCAGRLTVLTDVPLSSETTCAVALTGPGVSAETALGVIPGYPAKLTAGDISVPVQRAHVTSPASPRPSCVG
ncbi:4'-phosphopantetheinyl transferase family protein [Rhizohabitans arisaemae]|uniref:4'-phosphopantetheinyl transferase family protein n=1 Tax=Rhizohabitans arisaemae TaxID=2720610 RepID=UPI0024B1B2C6|nr:4'-phosphopantetheinyl transferase superfamily protein [Rhizohabitans arisaemae]